MCSVLVCCRRPSTLPYKLLTHSFQKTAGDILALHLTAPPVTLSRGGPGHVARLVQNPSQQFHLSPAQNRWRGQVRQHPRLSHLEQKHFNNFNAITHTYQQDRLDLQTFFLLQQRVCHSTLPCRRYGSHVVIRCKLPMPMPASLTCSLRNFTHVCLSSAQASFLSASRARKAARPLQSVRSIRESAGVRGRPTQ